MAYEMRIDLLRPVCNRVLPAVYTDELSYYEVLCKVTSKLNEVIELVGDYATVEQIKQSIKDLAEYVDRQDEALREYSDAKDEALKNYLLDVIANSALGKVTVLSNTVGGWVKLQPELDRMYDYLRYWALAAYLVDEKEYTAQAYDEIHMVGVLQPLTHRRQLLLRVFRRIVRLHGSSLPELQVLIRREKCHLLTKPRTPTCRSSYLPTSLPGLGT